MVCLRIALHVERTTHHLPAVIPFQRNSAKFVGWLEARKRAAENIKILQEKKAKLQSDTAQLAHTLDMEIAELKGACNK